MDVLWQQNFVQLFASLYCIQFSSNSMCSTEKNKSDLIILHDLLNAFFGLLSLFFVSLFVCRFFFRAYSCVFFCSFLLLCWWCSCSDFQLKPCITFQCFSFFSVHLSVLFICVRCRFCNWYFFTYSFQRINYSFHISNFLHQRMHEFNSQINYEPNDVNSLHYLEMYGWLMNWTSACVCENWNNMHK